jgi:hypothetical protein
MAMEIDRPSSRSQETLNGVSMSPTIVPGAPHKSRAYQLEMLEQSLHQNIIVTVSWMLPFTFISGLCYEKQHAANHFSLLDLDGHRKRENTNVRKGLLFSASFPT